MLEPGKISGYRLTHEYVPGWYVRVQLTRFAALAIAAGLSNMLTLTKYADGETTQLLRRAAVSVVNPVPSGLPIGGK